MWRKEISAIQVGIYAEERIFGNRKAKHVRDVVVIVHLV